MRNWKPVVSGLLALTMSASLLTSGITAAAVEENLTTDDIVILYTNDVHCGVDQIMEDDVVTNIGYAGVAAYKKAMQNLVGVDNVTLVDAGDAVQGDAIGTLSKGSYLVDIMNQVGYDIFVPGNHEFDYGMARMQELMEGLDATVVSSNFKSLPDESLLYAPYTMQTYGDTKVAFVGITTPESFTKSTPAYFQDESGNYIYSFCEEDNGQELYDAVQSAANAARDDGADYIVAVGHLGVDEQSAPWRSTDVIANTTGIDVFIDGHSHSVVVNQTVKNKDNIDVPLTQTGTKLANLGRMIIKPDGTITTELISGYDQQDSDTLTYIQGIESAFADDLAEKVGETNVALTVNHPDTGSRMVRNRETNLGDLCADAYRYVLGNGEGGPADVAFVNGGGIRADIDAGDITFGEVITVHPFNNVGCVVEATGQEILDALEMSSRTAPGESGGFLQVSGLTYTIDVSVPSTVVLDDKKNFITVSGTRRVKNVQIGGEPIDPAKTYTVASHNYMLLDGGDGINMFRDNTVVVNPVLLDNQVLINYIQNNLSGVVDDAYADPFGAGRIAIEGQAAVGFANATASLGMRSIARYSSYVHDADGGVQEIIDYNPVNKTIYSVNGHGGVLTAIAFGGLTDVGTVSGLPGRNIDVQSLVDIDGFTYGDMTSVAVSPNGTRLAAAIQAEGYDQPGRVALFTCNADGSLAFEKAYETGVQPDMVTFADNNMILTADEGEPREGYGDGITDPMGTVTIVDLTNDTVAKADFTGFDAQRDALTASGVVLKKDTAPSADLEPEYIAVAGGKAYVSLQEANAVAVLDLAAGTFDSVYPLGVQDYSMIAVDLDNNPGAANGAYSPRNYKNTFGLRMPDGISAYEAGGKTYILTANEGDSRDWAEDEPGEYLNEAELKLMATDGTTTNKKVRMLTNDYDGLPGLSDDTAHYLFGARSFSVFEASADGLTLVYDSGVDFEKKTADWLPEYFNCSNDDVDADSRSNKKGPEPENVTIGVVGAKTYAFVGLERVGGVMVYDITNPKNVSFVNYISSRDFGSTNSDGIGLDDSPEGLKFISSGKSPTGSALLLTAFEVSGDVTAYALTPQTVDQPVNLAIFSDPHLYSNELGTEGAAFDDYLANDRKMIRESVDILDEALRRILQSDATHVLVSGDLTKDGERVNHELLASKLALLEQYGKQVFVINGNHDLSNANALSYDGDSTAPVDTVNRDDFTSIYADLGYDQAIARDTNSLSYAVNLGDKYRLIVMDSCIYNNLTDENRAQETGGRLSAPSLSWALTQIRAAITAGRRPVGMLHHGLVPHTAVQPVLFPEYLIDNYQTISQQLANAGLGLVFTGHFHSQDVTAVTTASGRTLIDMETGSLVTYPSPIRYVSLDGNTVSYTSTAIDTVPEVPNFASYSNNYLLSGLTDLVPVMLTAVSPSLTPEAATVMAETELSPGLTLSQFLAYSMAKHYAGDEQPAELAPIIATLQAYSAGDDATNALYRLLGNAAWALANDTTGNITETACADTYTDNAGTLTFTTLPTSGGSSSGSSYGSGTGTSSSTASGTSATVSGTFNSSTGKSTASISAAIIDQLVESAKAAESNGAHALLEIKMENVAAVKTAELTIPGASFSKLAEATSAHMKINAGIASITFDAMAAKSIAETAGTSDVRITVNAVDTSALSEDVQKTVGDRPVYDFTVMSGNETVSSFGGGRAAVSVPYTLGAGENPHAVIVYYLNDAGSPQIVQGVYNADTETVDFTVTHFSRYAVGYHFVGFNDVADTDWYKDAVTFIAARSITSGTSANAFSPDASVTRGQFIVMLLRAYGIAPDDQSTDNFADAGNTYYTGYLANAKAMGIAGGIGNNRFAPESTISRQDMFTLLYRALDTLGKLPENSSSMTLSDFSDAAAVSSYAANAMAALVKAGVVSGSNGKLSPAENSTRAQTAQLLYNLLYTA